MPACMLVRTYQHQEPDSQSWQQLLQCRAQPPSRPSVRGLCSVMRPSELPPSEVCLRGAGGSGPLVLQPEEETGRFETLGEQRKSRGLDLPRVVSLSRHSYFFPSH